MRRRTNTLCVSSDEPKLIDRFKKRHPPKILFAEQVNYSMTMDPLEMMQTSSNESSSGTSQKSHGSKQKENNEAPFQFAQEEYTMEETKIQKQNTQVQLKQDSNNQNIIAEKDQDKDPLPKKEIVIVGQSIIYEEKTKGFRKGTRRRYSHKNSDYMTY